MGPNPDIRYNGGNTNDSKFLVSRYMNDSILSKVTSLGVSPTQLVSNVSRSGQLGTGIRYTKLDGATPAVFNPVVCVVLQVPRMWDRWPKLQETLRALVETHAKSITGIDFGYTLANEETVVGHDGQTLKVPTRTSRGQVTPSMTFQEYPGMPVFNLFRQWIFDIQHPDTNSSMLPSNLLGINGGDKTDSSEAQMCAWYMSAYSMSCCFIQYDPSGLPDRIYDAFIIANMFPTATGNVGFERTINTTTMKERSIEFTGLVQHNENTRELGVRIAEMLALHKINYQFALPGLAGTTDPDLAIENTIRTFGGIEYEAGSTHQNGGRVDNSALGETKDTPQGSIQQFNFLRKDGNHAYTDRLSRQDYSFSHSGASKSDYTTNNNTRLSAAANSNYYFANEGNYNLNTNTNNNAGGNAGNANQNTNFRG